MTAASLLLFCFLAGLTASPHCMLMCGPILAAFQTSDCNMAIANRRQQMRWRQAGRLSSYALLGGLVAVFGNGIATWIATRWDERISRLTVISAIVLIALLLWHGRGNGLLERMVRTPTAKLRQVIFKLSQYFPKQPRAQAYLSGWLWFCLPCGMLYAALAVVAINPNPALGALSMLVFGFGTMPAVYGGNWALTRMVRQLSPQRAHRLISLGVLGGMFVLVLPWVLERSLVANFLMECGIR